MCIGGCPYGLGAPAIPFGEIDPDPFIGSCGCCGTITPSWWFEWFGDPELRWSSHAIGDPIAWEDIDAIEWLPASSS